MVKNELSPARLLRESNFAVLMRAIEANEVVYDKARLFPTTPTLRTAALEIARKFCETKQSVQMASPTWQEIGREGTAP